MSAHAGFSELRLQHLSLRICTSPTLQSDDSVRSTSSFSLQRTPYDSCTPTLRIAGITVSTRSSFPAADASSVSAVFFPTALARTLYAQHRTKRRPRPDPGGRRRWLRGASPAAGAWRDPLRGEWRWTPLRAWERCRRTERTRVRSAWLCVRTHRSNHFLVATRAIRRLWLTPTLHWHCVCATISSLASAPLSSLTGSSDRRPESSRLRSTATGRRRVHRSSPPESRG